MRNNVNYKFGHGYKEDDGVEGYVTIMANTDPFRFKRRINYYSNPRF